MAHLRPIRAEDSAGLFLKWFVSIASSANDKSGIRLNHPLSRKRPSSAWEEQLGAFSTGSAQLLERVGRNIRVRPSYSEDSMALGMCKRCEKFAFLQLQVATASMSVVSRLTKLD